MINKKRIISALLSASLMIGFAPAYADGGESASKEKSVIFTEDFSSGEKWTQTKAGSLEISSGKLHFKKTFSDSAKSRITAEAYTFSNGHAAFDVKLTDCRGFAVLFRMSDENNNYKLSMEESGLTLEKKVNGGNYKKIASAVAALSAGAVHKIDIGLLGTRITVSADGEQYIDCIDESLSEGYIGFTAESGTAWADNLEIYELDSDIYVEKAVNENAVEIFVAPDGDDKEGNGSYEKPYATMNQARLAVRRLKSLNQPIHVVFKEGVYYADSAVVFESLDSGDSFVPITYMAEEGADVRFRGTRKIDTSKFKPVTDEKIRERMYEDVRDKVVQLDLKQQGFKREEIDTFIGIKDNVSDEGWAPTQLFLNNRKQQLAKWPNAGYATIETASNVNFNNVFTKIFFSNSEPMRWQEAKDAYIEGNLFYEWYEEQIPIKCINTEEMAIETARKSTYGARDDHEYRVMNLLEEIDMPGEWYIDFDEMILYYYPQHSLAAEDELEISTLEDCFVHLADVSGITFKNLVFEDNRGCVKPQGWGQPAGTSGGGIYIDRAAKNITIDGCTFKDINGVGIRRLTKVMGADMGELDCNLNIYIQNCNFYRNSYHGVYLRVGNAENLKQAKVYVRNNFLYDCALATVTSSVCGLEMSNNLLVKSFDASIRLGGAENTVTNNEIVYGSYNSSDMGAIYTGRNVAQHGTTISRNLIIDYGPKPTEERSFPAGAIYLDDTVGGITLEQNMSNARAANYQSTGIIYGGGPDVVYRGNVSLDANKAFIIQNRTGSQPSYLQQALSSYAGYINVNPDVWSAKYPETDRFKGYIEDYMTFESDITVEENLSTDSKNALVVTSADLNPKLTGTIDDAYVVDDKSIYVDAEHYDFRITREAKEKYNLPDSLPCEDNLDIDDIGLQRELEFNDALINFDITLPKPGETVTYANKVKLAWEASDAANLYEYEVARDPEFTDIAESGECMDNFAELTGLEPGKIYYARVTAKNTARKYNYELKNQNGVIEFTTPTTVYKNTAVYDQALSSLTEKLAGIKVGNKKGDCDGEKINEVKKYIAEAREIVKKPETTQAEIEQISTRLIGYYNAIDAYRNVGYRAIELNKKSKWTFTAPIKSQYLTDGRADFLTDAGGNMTLAGEIDNTDILCFRVKLTNIRGWEGFALKIKDASREMYGDDCYYVAIKDNIFELQRKGKILQVVDNNGIVKENTWYDFQLGCVTVEGGVNIVFNVNGQPVFDYLDNSAEAEYRSGSFAMNIRQNTGVSIAEPSYVPEGFFVPSEAIQEAVSSGKSTAFDFGADGFTKVAGEWSENKNYSQNSDSETGEIFATEAGAAARWMIKADGDTTYRVYYWNNPSADNDSAVTFTASGKDGTYKKTIDMTAGEEGYVELGTFKFVSDDAKVGIINLVFESSGGGKLPLSSVKIQKVDKTKYPDMLKENQ